MRFEAMTPRHWTFPMTPPSISRPALRTFLRPSFAVCLIVFLGFTGIGMAPPAQADTLELNDGRVVEGAVLGSATEKGKKGLLVLDRFGVAFVANDTIKKRTKGRDLDSQIRERLAKLPEDDFKNRARLARWMATVGRTEEALDLAARIIAKDPENAIAHGVLGHERFRGKWMTPDAAKRAQGLERHGNRWYTPDEWKNAQAKERDAANAAERKAQAAALRKKVNRLVGLMFSPHQATRERAEAALRALGDETKSKAIPELIERVKAYRNKLDDVRVKAAAGSIAGAGGGGTGYALTEFRVAMSKLKRPIREFQTSLASSLGGAPVTIQLPELSVIKVNTTALIPIVVD